MSTNQEQLLASVRALTGTAHDFNGDFMAMFDAVGVAAGSYNGRLLAWINQTLGASYTEVNGAKQAYAAALGFQNWDALTTVDPYPGATIALDLVGPFTAGFPFYKVNGLIYPSLAAIPGWSSTRASTGYALNSSGTLVSFGSGVPRITDLGFLSEAAATNNIKQSQALATTPWAATAGAAVNNALAAPDGTLTATSFTEDSTNASHELLQSVPFTASSTATFSAYAKAGSRSQVILIFGSGFVTGSASVVYNLTGSGSIVTTGTITGTITPLANGWYFLTATATSNTGNTAGNMFLGPGVANSVSYQGNGSLSAYFWGAQFEQGASATSYIPTTSSAATRAADVATIGGLSLSQATIAVMATPGATDSTFRRAVSLNDGTASNEAYIGIASGNAKGFVFAGGVQQAGFNGTTWTGSQKAALSYAAGAQAASYFGGAASTATGASAPTATHLDIGNVANSGQFDGYIQRVRVYTPPLSNSQLPGL